MRGNTMYSSPYFMIRIGNLKYIQRLYERDELYDLAYAADVLKMQKRILAWYMETADFVPNRKDLR